MLFLYCSVVMKYFGVFKGDRLITSGRIDKWTSEEHAKQLADNCNGEVHFSNENFSKPRDLSGPIIFGMTWQEIKDKQQKR